MSFVEKCLYKTTVVATNKNERLICVVLARMSMDTAGPAFESENSGEYTFTFTTHKKCLVLNEV